MDRFRIVLMLLVMCFNRPLSAQPERFPSLADSLAYLPAISPSEKYLELKALLHLAQVQHDMAEISEICYRLGKFYNGASYYRIARYWYLQSLRIREPRGPTGDLVKLYIQLSGNYAYTSMLDKSRQYILRALNTARSIRTADSTKALESIYFMMGSLHSEACRQSPKDMATRDFERMNQAISTKPAILGDWMSCDSAAYYFRLTRQKLRELKEYDMLKMNFGGISRKDTFQTVRDLKALLVKPTHVRGTHVRIATQVNLARFYMIIHKPKQAHYLLDDALEQYNHYNHNSPALLQQIRSTYVFIYRLTGDYQKAFNYQKLSYEYLLQKLDEDRNGAIERLGIEYDAEKRDTEIKNQRKLIGLRDARIATEKKVSYGLLGSLLTAIGISIAFYRLSQKNRRISEQNAALVKEQNHRVKNNLQAVSDLLMLQKFLIIDKVAHEAIAESQLRIQSIELLHKRLYDNPEHLVAVQLKRYIPDLVPHILDTYGLDHIQPVYAIDDIWLSADQMLPLGLILTETVTNSCKYAFPDHAAPALAIQVQQVAETVRLIVQDNGPGFVLPSGEITTYGLKLINIQAQQLHGTYSFHGDNGTRFELAFILIKSKKHSLVE